MMLVTRIMNIDIQNEPDKFSTQKKSITIEAVAFDMDGLMLNTEDLYAQVGHVLMGRRGKKYRDEVRNKMIGLPAPQAYGVLIEEEGMSETWQELQQETDEIFETILPTQLATMLGLIAEDVSRGKPNPDIYLAAAKKMSVEVENMLVLEDSPTGTQAGVSAGAYVVSVPNEHTKLGSFEGCRWIANSLLDGRIYGLLKRAVE